MKQISAGKQHCLLRIHQMRYSFKTAEKMLADYILNNQEIVISETMEGMAESSGVSYSTVYRFYRKLGFSGFRQFKESLIFDFLNSNEVSSLIHSFSFRENKTIEEICENVIKLAYKVLEDSYTIFDINEMSVVVDKLISARRICFIGVGISGLCARYAYCRFFRKGLNCVSDIDATLFKMQVSLLSEGDLLFAISSSGRTQTIVEAARLAKNNGVTVVGLSDFAITPLSKASNYNLHTTSRNIDLMSDIDMPLITGQITIIDMLYMCCTMKMGDAALQNFLKTDASAKSEKIG